MFPDPCGERFERAIASGVDPVAVVPDEYAVAKGGAPALPAVGPTPELAAAAVPHGQVRFTTVGTIRATGGTVTWIPELSRHNTVNRQHVNIVEAGVSRFSGLVPNPVPPQAADRRGQAVVPGRPLESLCNRPENGSNRLQDKALRLDHRFGRNLILYLGFRS
ncbi:MAG TPA: hypothetical protein VH092_03085, partial [Urbifossiella sp.]|nr:hypothetical protein [Urbifossiella sp.]